MLEFFYFIIQIITYYNIGQLLKKVFYLNNDFIIFLIVFNALYLIQIIINLINLEVSFIFLMLFYNIIICVIFMKKLFRIRNKKLNINFIINTKLNLNIVIIFLLIFKYINLYESNTDFINILNWVKLLDTSGFKLSNFPIGLTSQFNQIYLITNFIGNDLPNISLLHLVNCIALILFITNKYIKYKIYLVFCLLTPIIDKILINFIYLTTISYSSFLFGQYLYISYQYIKNKKKSNLAILILITFSLIFTSHLNMVLILPTILILNVHIFRKLLNGVGFNIISLTILFITILLELYLRKSFNSSIYQYANYLFEGKITTYSVLRYLGIIASAGLIFLLIFFNVGHILNLNIRTFLKKKNIILDFEILKFIIASILTILLHFTQEMAGIFTLKQVEGRLFVYTVVLVLIIYHVLDREVRYSKRYD